MITLALALVLLSNYIQLFTSQPVSAQEISVSYYYSLSPEAPKYGASAVKVAHANLDAPKGGAISIARLGEVYNLNPFMSGKNEPPGEILDLITDSLMERTKDDPLVQYGLIAESIQLPKTLAWAVFKIRKQARWHDGSPVTSQDIVFSFNMLKANSSIQGFPYHNYFTDILSAVPIGTSKVKFVFKKHGNRDLPWIVGEMPIFSKAVWQKRDLKATIQIPELLGGMGGPYRVGTTEDAMKSIVLEKVPEYWGAQLFLNNGRYNFDQIIFKSYLSPTDSFKSFRNGLHDFRDEFMMQNWGEALSLSGTLTDLLVLRELPHGRTQGMQGYVLNIRKPILKNVHLRRALAYGFDFEFVNQKIFFGAYKRSESYFNNCDDLTSGKAPDSSEKAILKPLQRFFVYSNELMTKPYTAPTTDGEGNISSNIIKASDILKRAGYVTNSKGVLLDPLMQKPVKLDILLLNGGGLEYPTLLLAENLERLGIDITISPVNRTVMDQKILERDFDIVVWRLPSARSPGVEQVQMWGSKSAYSPGSPNIVGLKNKGIDAILNRLVRAKNRAELATIARSLDRALLWEHLVIPQWYSDKDRIAYWNKFDETQLDCPCGYDLYSWWVNEKKLNQVRDYFTSGEAQSVDQNMEEMVRSN